MHGIFLSQSLLTSQSLRATIGPLQFSLRHWNLRNLTLRNVTLQARLSITRDFFRQHSTFARLYNAAASPASRLPSAGSLKINLYGNVSRDTAKVKLLNEMLKAFHIDFSLAKLQMIVIHLRRKQLCYLIN